MKKKDKKIIIILGVIILLLLIFTLTFITVNSKYKNNNILEEKESLITIQNNKEKEFVIEGYTIDNPNIILDPYGNSPLTALILFETDKDIEPTIKIIGKDKNTTYSNKFKKSKKHYLPVYGLYANRENRVIISYDDVEKEIIIKTGDLPKGIILPTSVNANKDKLDNELYFYTPSSMGYTCAYDVNGDIRWYLKNIAVWDNTRLKNGHMIVSTERRVNPPYYMSGLYEIDMLGKIYNEYSVKGGYHHDYFELPNGNLLVLSNDFNNEDGTVEDFIVELDRKSGNIIKEIDLKDIIDMEESKSENWSSYDWFHNNSIWYDEETNSITLSGRHQDAIINIDYKTNKLNWIIGDPTNWSDKYQKYFFKPVEGKDFEWQWSQHAAMITPEGYVFVLDNGNNKSKIKEEYVKAEDSYTRGVMYKIDTKKMTIEQVWEYGKDRGSKFYSPYISDVDYLDKDNYIVHSGGIVYVDGKNSNQPAGFSTNATLYSDTVELLNDEVIFELVLPTNNYRVEKLPLYSNDEFKLGKGNKLGSLGKTPLVIRKLILNRKTNKIDSEYNKHNIKLTNEEDRLVFNGQFKKGTKVNLYLYNSMFTRIYEVKVSKKPYTALCIDVFTDKEDKNGIVINSYINKEGLHGKYSIYVEIDGKLYDTEYIFDGKK